LDELLQKVTAREVVLVGTGKAIYAVGAGECEVWRHPSSKDTRLYDVPAPRREGQKGRSRKYGEKYTPERIEHLDRWTATLNIYGKEQRVLLRSKLVKARFLNGKLVRAVWCEFANDKKQNQWKTASLLLSTDTTLTAEQVV
jgi:hypothetical protein